MSNLKITQLTEEQVKDRIVCGAIENDYIIVHDCNVLYPLYKQELKQILGCLNSGDAFVHIEEVSE